MKKTWKTISLILFLKLFASLSALNAQMIFTHPSDYYLPQPFPPIGAAFYASGGADLHLADPTMSFINPAANGWQDRGIYVEFYYHNDGQKNLDKYFENIVGLDKHLEKIPTCFFSPTNGKTMLLHLDMCV